MRHVENIKHLRNIFIDDGKQESELYVRIAKIGTVMYQIQYLEEERLVLKKKVKLVIFILVSVPIFTSGCECRIMSERVQL